MAKKVLRDKYKGELTIKDMSVLRENKSAKEQVKIPYGDLKEYSLNHAVSMAWDIDIPNKIFRFNIDYHRYYLTWYELRDLDRTGFFRREEGCPRHYQMRWHDGKKIELSTDLNDEATRDMIVLLTTSDGHECYIDWYEVLRFGRFI